MSGHGHATMSPPPSTAPTFVLRPIGHVESILTDPASAPRQGDEGAPDASLEIEADMWAGCADLRPGDEIIVLTWLHRAERDQLVVRPRDDPARTLTGVFSTRSADRPNPIGLHHIRVLAIDATTILVSGLEALDRTPILDIKPIVGQLSDR